MTSFVGVLRQYGGEQPVPRAPVDLTRLMKSTGRVGLGRFSSQTHRVDDPHWMFAPPDLPVTTIHPRDELAMPEDAPARRRRAAAVGTGRRPPANADPHRPPVNARDRRRRERMGLRVGGDSPDMRRNVMPEISHTFLRHGHSGLRLTSLAFLP
ncbi:hypothetical protein PIB30_069902 [Stylosanthes scabra]|uniref:Uncharacterized protein n=1 Tax=Stylosanthes scabra TaxID=79078 RepID=A0ABU6VLQ1_9FABA|nr:hypothetical protein [Stylosanthes scabra]